MSDSHSQGTSGGFRTASDGEERSLSPIRTDRERSVTPEPQQGSIRTEHGENTSESKTDGNGRKYYAGVDMRVD